MNNIKENLSVIVFSKDRPLQLQAYLKSLLYFSKIEGSSITVLYKFNPQISYDDLFKQFPEVLWVKEAAFYDDLVSLINRSKNYIMFGCDDVIFKNDIDISYALSVMSNSENIFGFSLRLGTNIKPMPLDVANFELYLKWDWQKVRETNWNYPWELDSTIYRKTDVINIVSVLESKMIKNPNFLEGEVASQPKKFISKTEFASFKKGKCIVLTVNRVQDDFENGFDNTLNTDISSLYQLYKEGCSIDIIRISRKPHNKIHVGVEYFKIIGINKPYNSLKMSLQIFFRKGWRFLKRCYHGSSSHKN